MTVIQKLTNAFPSNNLPFQIFFNPDCLLHDTGLDHPECSQRLNAIIEGCLEIEQKELVNFQYPAPASIRVLSVLHDEEYLSCLESACLEGQRWFMSRDNVVCPDSFEAILATGGLALALGKHLASGRGGFALARPPGHHAGKAKAEGFVFSII